MSTFRFVLIVILAVFASLTAGVAAGAFVSLVLIEPAKAHEWYDYACCEDHDCNVIDPKELSFDASKRIWTWRSSRSGATHFIHADSRSPLDSGFRIRASKDGQYHGCERDVAGKGTPPKWVPYCLYLPELY